MVLELTTEQKAKALTRILWQWSYKEKSAEDTVYEIYKLFEKETLYTMNDPLEKLLV